MLLLVLGANPLKLFIIVTAARSCVRRSCRPHWLGVDRSVVRTLTSVGSCPTPGPHLLLQLGQVGHVGSEENVLDRVDPLPLLELAHWEVAGRAAEIRTCPAITKKISLSIVKRILFHDLSNLAKQYSEPLLNFLQLATAGQQLQSLIRISAFLSSVKACLFSIKLYSLL
jgi:hypothetical protein